MIKNQFQTRLEKVLKEIKTLYDDNHIGVKLTIRLPKNENIPFDVRMALKILEKREAIIDTIYYDLKVKK